MAKAPKPKAGGYDAAKERMERAKKAYRITLADGDLTFVYRPFGIPTYVRSHVRDVTGMAVDQLLWERGAFDVQTICDYWWISRLCADETTRIMVGADGENSTEIPLPRRQVQDELDRLAPGAVYADFVQEDISDEVDDSPEA